MRIYLRFRRLINHSLRRVKNFIKLLNGLKKIEDRVSNLEMHVPMLSSSTIDRIKHLSRILQPKQSGLKLIRVGNHGDGGYVIAPPPHKSLVLSLGVGYEISADIQMIEDFDCEIYAFDPFVERPNIDSKNFNFYQIGFGENSENIMNLQFKQLKQILQILPKKPDLAFIDIEGDEWLLTEEISLLSELSQIVIEFHNLDKIIDDSFYHRILTLLSNILKHHSSIHVHGNNDGKTIPIGGATWPSILEVTFLRNDLLLENFTKDNYGPFPTPLDSSNSSVRPDLYLEPFFGQKANYREI